MDNKVIGKQGEDLAADYLVQHGYSICARNYRVKTGEIDIIASQPGLVAFVEVKARRSLRCGTPAQAVNYHKQQKIIQTARWYLRQRHLEEKCLCRFDVIEVYLGKAQADIRHIPGAFEL